MFNILEKIINIFMESKKPFQLLKEQEKIIHKKTKTKENITHIIIFPQIIYISFISLCLLAKINSDDCPTTTQYNKPYISVLITEPGRKLLVTKGSTIVPEYSFFTPCSNSIKLGIVGGLKYLFEDEYSVEIKKEETNITMEFKEETLNLQNLFKDLGHIKRVDLSNFDKKPTDISNMFSGCIKLEEVIFGGFDTSMVENMAGMFKGTIISSLDLSSFDTRNVKNINSMFDSCTNLKYLNLSNFDFSNVSSASSTLNKCQNSLEYLNIYSYKDDQKFDSNFLQNANKNLIFCIDSVKAPKLFLDLTSKNYTIKCSEKAEETFLIETEELIPISSPAIATTTINIEDKEDIQTTEATIKTPDSIDDCSGEELFSNKCGEENQTLSIENKDNLINNIMSDIESGNLNDIIDDLLIGEENDYVIKKDDIIFQLTTSENQESNEYNNISSIQLGNCETILRNYYSIAPDLPLIILKVDYMFEDFNIPVIGYEVFHPLSNLKLNLSLCDNTTVIYNIPVDVKENELEKYNTSSDYYNDECSVYTTEDGTDIIISDRKKEFNDNNMFLCENSCEYTNYNLSTKKSVCNCEVKSKLFSISELTSNKESISQSFNISASSDSDSNLNLMKCIDTLFSKYGLLKNLEFYILIIMSLLFLGSTIFFYRMGYPILESDIKDILDNKYEVQQKGKKKRKSKNIKSNSKMKENNLDNNKNNNINKNTNNNNQINPKKDPNIYLSNPKKRRNTRKNIARNKEQGITISKNINIKENDSKSLTKIKMIGNNNTIDNNYKAINNSNICNHDNNEIKNTNNIPDINSLTIYELNNLPYEQALLIDKRDFMEYYISLIRTKHPLFFSFVPLNDYNILIIKIDLFILNFVTSSAINALFFTKPTIHKIYMDKGKYNLGFFLGKIFISFIISHVIFVIIKNFILSEKNVINIKKKLTYDESCDEADKTKRCLIIKYISFYAVGIVFIILFWYYLSSFCAVYKNTQIFLIINTFITLAISFIYPFVINLLPAFIRKISLQNNDKKCLYRVNRYIQII